jgi:hypothetical protein
MIKKMGIILGLVACVGCTSNGVIEQGKEVSPVEAAITVKYSPVKPTVKPKVQTTPRVKVTKDIAPSVQESAESIRFDIEGVAKFFGMKPSAFTTIDYNLKYTYISTKARSDGMIYEFDVYDNGNVAYGGDGVYMGNFKTGAKFNIIGFKSYMMAIGEVPNVEELDYKSNDGYKEITLNNTRFELNLIDDIILKDGKDFGDLGDICETNHCYDYAEELKTLVGGDMDISYIDNINSISFILGDMHNIGDINPTCIDFLTSYHNGDHMVDTFGVVTIVAENRVYFDLLKGSPDGTDLGSGGSGSGYLDFSKDKSSLTVSWIGNAPETLSDSIGFSTDFGDVYVRG